MNIDAAARRIIEAALEKDPAHPEAAIFNAMMDARSYAGMSHEQSVGVSKVLYAKWSVALRWRERPD